MVQLGDLNHPMLLRLADESAFIYPKALLACASHHEKTKRLGKIFPRTGWGGVSWKYQDNVNRKTFHALSLLE